MRRVTRVPRGVKAGRGTYFASAPKILWDKYGSKLIIGSYTSIAENVTIFLGGHHNTSSVSMGLNLRSKGSTYSKGDVVIGSDVWIGCGAVILDGVAIGDGAVVGAFSVVASDVDPYAVVAGNPARRIRYRFPADQAATLLKIRWWDWPEAKIVEHHKALRSDNVNEFIRRFG